MELYKKSHFLNDQLSKKNHTVGFEIIIVVPQTQQHSNEGSVRVRLSLV